MKIGYISGMALYLSIISIVYITSLGAAKELPIYLGWPYIRGPYKWDALYLNKNKLFSLNELFATHNTCFVGSFSYFFFIELPMSNAYLTEASSHPSLTASFSSSRLCQPHFIVSNLILLEKLAKTFRSSVTPNLKPA